MAQHSALVAHCLRSALCFDSQAVQVGKCLFSELRQRDSTSAYGNIYTFSAAASTAAVVLS
jgi:hypothetical protein